MKYLIVGRTSSGKDYLAKKLVQQGLKQVISYTTREKRTPDEDTHIFITPQEASTYTDKVAYTVIDEAEYFATREQVHESDIYIIDPRGLDMLVKNMPETEFQIIYVHADDDQRRIHAVQRAENKIKAEEKFISRDASEDDQFTEFEEIVYEKMNSEACFPDNVTSVILIENDFKEESAERYMKMLLNRKEQIRRMCMIVNDCVSLGILRTPENDDRHILVTYYENGNLVEKEKTIENCAMRILGDPEGFHEVMSQYLLLSPKFE